MADFTGSSGCRPRLDRCRSHNTRANSGSKVLSKLTSIDVALGEEPEYFGRCVPPRKKRTHNPLFVVRAHDDQQVGFKPAELSTSDSN